MPSGPNCPCPHFPAVTPFQLWPSSRWGCCKGLGDSGVCRHAFLFVNCVVLEAERFHLWTCPAGNLSFAAREETPGWMRTWIH